MVQINHNVHHEVTHIHEEPKEDKLSLFKHKLAGVFEEIVEAPEPDEVVEEKIDNLKSTFEEVARPVDEEKTDDDDDSDDLIEKEREATRSKIHEFIVGNLNAAAAHWKETGDVGVHFEPHVSLRERVNGFLSRFHHVKPEVQVKMEQQAEVVAERVEERVKEAEDSGQVIDTDQIVKEEWKNIVSKMDTVTSSEREEIEKIYKELSGN